MVSSPNVPITLGYRVPNYSDGSNEPDKIIFREIAIDRTTLPKLNVVYLNNNDKPIYEDIASFIGAQTPYIPTQRSLVIESSSPLDLHCEDDCFVVFKLSTDDNWHFSTEGDCFTTKQDFGIKYSNLIHVMSDNRRYGTGTPIPSGCRLLFFRSRCNATAHYDGFNLSVDLDLGTAVNPQNGEIELRRTKLVIDPDIRFPGGSGA
jgi:hypothetical protein